MSSRLPILLVAMTALTMSTACDKLFNSNPNSPSGEKTSVTFVDEGGRFSPGVYPAPVCVNGATYVYVNTGADGVMVQASSDGLSFAPTPASYPAGVSRTIVRLPDGRFRMYYFSDGTSFDVRSAVSSNGLNWTVESGIRYSESGMAGMRAAVLPTGYRLYYGNAGTTRSAISSDGLAFTAEGPVTLPAPDGTATFGALDVASLGSRFHMILTRFPTSGSSELWHAVSTDGRNWTLDQSALAVNPGVPLNQPAWCITGTLRVYYRAQPAGSNAIASGIIKF
jgi:hypothetical protein